MKGEGTPERDLKERDKLVGRRKAKERDRGQEV